MHIILKELFAVPKPMSIIRILLTAVILISMALFKGFPVSLVFLYIYKELLILLSGSLMLKKNNTAPASNFWGRLNSAFIIAACFLFLLNITNLFFSMILAAAYLSTFAAGVSYYRSVERILFTKRLSKNLSRIAVIILTGAAVQLSLSADLTAAQINYQSDENFEGREELIRKYAPVLYFAGGEEFFPIEVSSFLDHSTLMESSFMIFFDKKIQGSADSLIKQPGYQSTDFYLKLNRGLTESIAEQYKNVKERYRRVVYAAAFKVFNEHSVNYIIQYWFFLWGSDLGSRRIAWHEGDWEMIMIHLDENFEPVRAGYSQHYYGEVLPWDKVEKETGHPVIYMSKGGHSLHFSAGDFGTYIDNSKKIQLGSDICRKDIRWGPADYEIDVVSDTTGWINFEGYWGIPITTKLPGPKFRHPKDTDLTMWQNPMGWFEKYDEDQNN